MAKEKRRGQGSKKEKVRVNVRGYMCSLGEKGRRSRDKTDDKWSDEKAKECEGTIDKDKSAKHKGMGMRSLLKGVMKQTGGRRNERNRKHKKKGTKESGEETLSANRTLVGPSQGERRERKNNNTKRRLNETIKKNTCE